MYKQLLNELLQTRTRKELAKQLGVNESTINRWQREEVFPKGQNLIKLLDMKTANRSETMTTNLTLSAANRILTKLGLPEIRKANHTEAQPDGYGNIAKYAIDAAQFQSRNVDVKLVDLFIKHLRANWEDVELSKLTDKEQQLVNDLV